jgi:uncharacterized repeat protein (TIGR03803 family)
MTYFGGINDNGILFDINPLTNIEKVLVRFNDTNGMNPLGTVVEDSARGLLFGMTALGGKYNDGVIFSYNINTGKDSILLNFDGSNGRVLLADLLMVKDSSTGINEIRNDVAGVKLYPNPSNGIFTVALCHPELVSGSQTMGVYNVMGQKVYYGMLNRVQHDYNIDLSSKPGGIYFYRVTSVDGSLVREGKLIIQK